MFREYFFNNSNNSNNSSVDNLLNEERYNPEEVIGFIIGAGIKIKKEEWLNDKVIIYLYNDYDIDLIKNNFKQLDIKNKKIIIFF